MRMSVTDGHTVISIITRYVLLFGGSSLLQVNGAFQCQHFAPQCYHCKTPIVDERFITLDDPALGKRTYHEQHFFCAECGDPFLAPAQPKPGSSAALGKNQGITIHGDGAFDLEDDVGFTVFKGHPYCETCHVRLRAPKCRGCGKSIREGVGYEMPMDDDGRRGAIEALGGKWHWECFVCSVS